MGVFARKQRQSLPECPATLSRGKPGIAEKGTSYTTVHLESTDWNPLPSTIASAGRNLDRLRIDCAASTGEGRANAPLLALFFCSMLIVSHSLREQPRNTPKTRNEKFCVLRVFR